MAHRAIICVGHGASLWGPRGRAPGLATQAASCLEMRGWQPSLKTGASPMTDEAMSPLRRRRVGLGNFKYPVTSEDRHGRARTMKDPSGGPALFCVKTRKAL